MGTHTQASPETETRIKQLFRSFGNFRNIQVVGLLVAWGILIVVISRLAPYFLTLNNVLTITKFSVTSFIAAAGMTIALISGGLDLSLGATMMLAGVVAGTLFTRGISFPMALLAGWLIGPIAGIINGTLITRAKVNPLIATLGMMFILRGTGYTIAGGKARAIPDDIYQWARSSISGIPAPVFIMGAVLILVYFMLNHTKLGRHILLLEAALLLHAKLR